MKLSRLAVGSLVLLPLLLGPLPAHAQSKAAAPAVVSTLDVCQDLTTGNWRYSGVVAIAGKDTLTGTAVDYKIQNSVSSEGYKDALWLPKVPGKELGVLDPKSGATVFSFSGDAPPMSLGTLRNAATASFLDKTASVSTIGAAYTAQVCGCPVVGCTRTQGYWSNKPGVVWPSPLDRTAPFYSSGVTWQQLFDTPPRGNAYIILAHQFMASALTKATGASMPSGVQSAYFAAAAWFASGTTLATCAPGECSTQKAWSATLDTYNNGVYPGGPPHCPD
jgi:hypothetical protein